MWDKETCTVPIIIGALKSISRSIDIYLKKLYTSYSLNTSQKNCNVRNCQHFEKSIIYQIKKKLKKVQTLNKKMVNYKQLFTNILSSQACQYCKNINLLFHLSSTQNN